MTTRRFSAWSPKITESGDATAAQNCELLPHTAVTAVMNDVFSEHQRSENEKSPNTKGRRQWEYSSSNGSESYSFHYSACWPWALSHVVNPMLLRASLIRLRQRQHQHKRPVPTATQVVIEVTPAPIPTETPIPTATAVPPTPEPTVDLDALYDIGDERPFPDLLLTAAESHDRDEAVVLWDAFLSNTRVIGEIDGPNILDLCADHTGKWIVGSHVELKALTGMTFTWELKGSVAGRWNEPQLVMTSDQFGSLIYGSHLIHLVNPTTIYTTLLPTAGLVSGKDKPGHPSHTVMTNQDKDYNYEFSDTTDTTCTR
jgi:hypothetical protein